MADDFVSFVDGGGNFMWLTSSDNACTFPAGGCDARNEVVDTLDGWTERGLPRTGWSACRGRCYCVLVPVLGISIGDGDFGFDSSRTDNDVRDPDEAFADVDRLDPEDFIAELGRLPLAGKARADIERLLERFRDGKVTFRQAIELADRILGLA